MQQWLIRVAANVVQAVEKSKVTDTTYSMDYLIEKFEEAVSVLATGEGDARSRVGDAYVCFYHILTTEYPQSLRHQVESITEMLTRLEGRDGFIVFDNLRRMKNRTASKIAQVILEVYLQLVDLRGSGDA